MKQSIRKALPTIKMLADSLQKVAAAVARRAEKNCMPVRLQVNQEEGKWRLWWGDPCYDTDLRGVWGSGTIHFGATRAECLTLSREMRWEAIDQFELEQD